MQKILIFTMSVIFFFSGCDFVEAVGDGNSSTPSVSIPLGANSAVVEKISLKKELEQVPTLVVVMNWNNYSESDEQVWYDVIFNTSKNSVNAWYKNYTNSYLELVPVQENSGTSNNGIIMVAMGIDHPGDSDAAFRDTEITNAITSSAVKDSVDFASLDTDYNGMLDFTELQIFFVVAGGETSYGDASSKSIWAHAWAYNDGNAPVVDGVALMQNTGSFPSGSYMRFGAHHSVDNADDHIATIGVITHEIGHSLLGMYDVYDTSGGGSGLGFYDLMSGGGWAYKTSDTYAGTTPTQMSAYSLENSYLGKDTLTLSDVESVTLKCSSGEFVKLITSKTNEYFVLECRDSAKTFSDMSLNTADASFTTNKLFALLYHIDTLKYDNQESGAQTLSNHYMASLVERNSATLMTNRVGIDADYSDVYTVGYEIDTSQTRMYDGSASGYSIIVTSDDYTNRTMTFNIHKVEE